MSPHKKEPRNARIAIIGIISVVLLFAIHMALIVFYNLYLQRKVAERAAQPARLLSTLRAEERELLASYSYDRETGTIHIPIEEAMRLEARSPWRPSTPRPAFVDTATSPASALADEEAGNHGDPSATAQDGL